MNLLRLANDQRQSCFVRPDRSQSADFLPRVRFNNRRQQVNQRVEFKLLLSRAAELSVHARSATHHEW